MNPRRSLLLAVIAILIGFVQFFAVLDFLGLYVGLNIIITTLMAAFLVLYLPIIASILGFFGMLYSWDWLWWQAGLFFSISLIFYSILEILGLGFSYVLRFTRAGFAKLGRLFKK